MEGHADTGASRDAFGRQRARFGALGHAGVGVDDLAEIGIETFEFCADA